jgi:hypothetical protein
MARDCTAVATANKTAALKALIVANSGFIGLGP